MSKDELLEQLRANVITLIQDHKVSHSCIKDEIHACIKELSDKLPKTLVLYSDIHGGYGYSKSFSRFLESGDIGESSGSGEDGGVDSDDSSAFVPHWLQERMVHVEYVKAFGKECKEKYPFVRKLITIYNKYSLKAVFKLAHFLDFTKGDSKKYDALSDLIKETNDGEFGSDENITFVSSWLKDIKRLKQYSKSKLLEWIKNKNILNAMEMMEHKEKITEAIGDHRYKLVVDNYYSLFAEEKAEEKKQWYARKNWYEKLVPEKGLVRLSFLDAIEEYGESHFAIWTCQHYYCEEAMRFLLRFDEEFMVDEADYDEHCSDIDMGLLCASGGYARLRVGEAPKLLAWYIGEYDGKESIVVKP